MSELDSLASHARVLSSKVEFWNSAVLWALLITALAAGAIVLSQRLAFVRAKQLADVQDKITSIKEADAKLVQERVETELARQQERAATAERSLLELQERVKLRHLSAEQRRKFIDFLTMPAAAAAPKGPIRVQRLLLDETAQPFALEIKEALAAAGWPSDEIGRDMIPPGGRTPIGIILVVHGAQAIPAHAGVIQHALIAAGLEPTLGENPNVPEGMVEILIGIKP